MRHGLARSAFMSALLAALALPVLAAPAPAPAAGSGEAIYQQRCAVCHEGNVPKAPRREALGKMSAELLWFAITRGDMTERAAGLSAVEKSALIDYLAPEGSSEIPADSPTAYCKRSGPRHPLFSSQGRWNGWGNGPAQWRFQSARDAGLTAGEVPRLALKWAFAFPGVTKMAGEPAIEGGRLFIGSTGRKVYSLDAREGCLYWGFQTEYPVRTGMTLGSAGHTRAVFFGDQGGYAYALEASTGRVLWRTRVEDYLDAFITGTPALAGHTLLVPAASNEDAFGALPTYPCCRFRGSVSALDAESGKLLWKTYTISQAPQPVRKNSAGAQMWAPSGAGVWTSPTIDEAHERFYVTTANSNSPPAAETADAFIAFDLRTGALLWSKQMTAGDAYTLACDAPAPYSANCPGAKGPDFDFASSAMLVRLASGKRALIAGQKSGMLHAIDPDADGRVLWQERVGHGGHIGGIQWGSATDGKTVYVALSDIGLQPAAAGSPGAQPMLGTWIKNDPNQGGGLSAFDVATGQLLWHTPHPGCMDHPGCSPAQSAAVTVIPGAVFSGGVDGHLRAYRASDGRIIWDVDTERRYTTVDGVPGTGGSIDGPGPVIVDGMVYVNSGYAYFGGAPGNVLLAFSVGGK